MEADIPIVQDVLTVLSEANIHLNVQPSAGKIIGNSINGIRDIFYPRIGYFIGHTQQIKHLERDPDIFKIAQHFTVFVFLLLAVQ